MDIACKNDDPSKSNACQYVKDDGTVCGETNTFGVEIFDEFNRIYENRLDYIDKEIGSDCAELKYPVYKDWVRDLKAQNKKFIQILDELEREANHRFELLETKLKNDTNSFGGDSRFKKLENDLKNLLELIHRALECNKWNVDGLEFQTITIEDIFGKFLKKNGSTPAISSASDEADICMQELKCQVDCLKNELKRKNCIIEDYEGKVKHLQIDCCNRTPSCENLDTKTDLEDKFKTYIEELKIIIKDKDAKNSLLNKENENLKLSLSRNLEKCPEPDPKNESESQAQETEPSAARLKCCLIDCSHLDLDKVENCDRIQSDISVCNRLNKEISDLLTQIRARESHICNQNSIICNFQEKLNETRLQLKLITCERDQVCNKLSIIESELEKIKDDINQCPESKGTNFGIDMSSCSPCTDDDDPCKTKCDKKSVILNLKPMVNCMREKIVTLSRENCCLKCDLEEFKETLSESQCEIINLKKKLTELSKKPCADKEVLVKFKCNNKDLCADMEYQDAVENNCCVVDKISKRKEPNVQQFKLIFKEFLNKFGVDVDECDLDRLVRGNKKCIDKLVACIKQKLQTKSDISVCESTPDVCQLRDVLCTKESEIFDLKSKLIKLNIEAENCSQTMQQLNEDKIKIICEERDRLDLECKNQLTTIANLREALEMVKRGNNIPSSSSSDEDLSLLSEQLGSYFEDNMKMERQIDLIRDENLELKRQLFDLESYYALLDDRQQMDSVVTSRREKSIYKLLKKDLDQIKKQSSTIQSSLCNRETELKKLKYFRDKCLEMEINCRSELEMQKSHYTKIIKELHEELASLSDQLAEQQKESLQQNDLINDTSALEKSISEIENQNDILQKTLCSYECRLHDSEDKRNKLKSDRNKLKCELESLQNDIFDKDKTICELKCEIDKLKLHDSCRSGDDNNSCKRPSSSSGYDNSRTLDIIKRLNCELQSVKKAALEDKNNLSHEIDEYCTQIGKLKNKICCLENLVAKRDKEVESLNEKLLKIEKRTCQLEDDLYTKTSRVSQLEREDFKLREVVNKLTLQLSESKKETHCNEKHLMSELNCYKEKVDEQKKVIKCLKLQYDKSHDEIKNIKSLEEAFNKENLRLKREICDAKEQIATLEGRDGQISKLLSQAQQDLQKERDDVNRLKQIEYEFCKLREQNCKIYQHNCELTKKFKVSESEYEKLSIEYKKLLDVKEQALAALKTARAWQVENCEREKLIKLKLEKNSEHIQTLTKDRKQLISKMNQMHRDELILRSEIDVLKEKLCHCRCSRKYAFTDTENSGSSVLTRVDRYSSDPELNNDDQDDRCLKSVKQTTKKIYRTRKFWQNGIKNACD